jgi:hypothetical protein
MGSWFDSEKDNTMAITCNICGYTLNPDDAQLCGICQRPLNVTGRLAETNVAGDIQTEVMPPIRTARSARPAATADNPQQADAINLNILEGRLSHVEQHDELPAKGVYQILSYLLLFFCFGIPYVVLFLLSGIFSFSLIILGFTNVAAVFNPVSWTHFISEMLEVVFLKRIGFNNMVPVYRGMVQLVSGNDVHFQFFGPLRLGNLIEGHRIRFQGRMQGGNFIARSGMDLDTSAQISSGHRDPWPIIFAFILIVSCGFFTYGYLTFWPQIQPFVMRLMR